MYASKLCIFIVDSIQSIHRTNKLQIFNFDFPLIFDGKKMHVFVHKGLELTYLVNFYR